MGNPVVARLVRWAAWIVVVGIIAVGGAGLVVTLDHAQTDAARPELTARGDAIVTPRLDAMDASLGSLADAAAALAAHGRQALVDLRDQQPDAVRQELAAGDTALTASLAALADARARRASLYDGTSEAHVSGATRDRVDQVDAAIAAAGTLSQAWSDAAGPATLPAAVLAALARHDAAVVQATDAARNADYATAVARLADAGDVLATAQKARDQAKSKGLETSTLTGWINRAAGYDAALRHLYSLLRASGGVMTPAATAALTDVRRAQAALPADTAPLVVIVSDLGGQAMARGLIAIDQARAPLDAAVGR